MVWVGGLHSWFGTFGSSLWKGLGFLRAPDSNPKPPGPKPTIEVQRVFLFHCLQFQVQFSGYSPRGELLPWSFSLRATTINGTDLVSTAYHDGGWIRRMFSEGLQPFTTLKKHHSVKFIRKDHHSVKSNYCLTNLNCLAIFKGFHHLFGAFTQKKNGFDHSFEMWSWLQSWRNRVNCW